MIGLVFSGVMFILVGPEPLTGLKANIYITGGAMALTQFLAPYVFVPLIPEFIDNLKFYWPSISDSYQSDLSSALYNSGCAIAETFAPIIGSQLD